VVWLSSANMIIDLKSFLKHYPDLNTDLVEALTKFNNNSFIDAGLAEFVFSELTKTKIPVEHTKWTYNIILRNETVASEVVKSFYEHMETSRVIPLDVLLQMAKHISTPGDVLEKMSYLEQAGILIPSVIASNPYTPVWLLEDMFERFSKKNTDELFLVLFIEKLSSNPNATLNILNVLVERNSPEINRFIIMNENSTTAILRKIDLKAIKPFFFNNGYRFFQGKMDEDLFKEVINCGDKDSDKTPFYADPLMKSEYIIKDALEGNGYAQRALLSVYHEKYYDDFVNHLENNNIKVKGLPVLMVANMLGWNV
jgi:hypothetical protein